MTVVVRGDHGPCTVYPCLFFCDSGCELPRGAETFLFSWNWGCQQFGTDSSQRWGGGVSACHWEEIRHSPILFLKTID